MRVNFIINTNLENRDDSEEISESLKEFFDWFSDENVVTCEFPDEEPSEYHH